jgi:hypothetical protein
MKKTPSLSNKEKTMKSSIKKLKDVTLKTVAIWPAAITVHGVFFVLGVYSLYLMRDGKKKQ